MFVITSVGFVLMPPLRGVEMEVWVVYVACLDGKITNAWGEDVASLLRSRGDLFFFMEIHS